MANGVKKKDIIFEGKDPIIKIKTPLEQLFDDYKKNNQLIWFGYGFMCGCLFVFLLSSIIIGSIIS